MKTTKIIAAILLAILATLSLYSCGGDDNEVSIPTGDVNVTVKISTDDYGVLAEGAVGLAEGSSVLDAITTFCSSTMDKDGDGNVDGEIGIEYENDENGLPISVVQLGDYKETEKNKLSYYWSFMLNGKEPEGRAAENVVADGDVVIYNYTFIPTGDYVTVRFEAEDKVIVKDTVVVFDAGDTVLDVALDALKRSGLEYSESEDGTAIQSVDDYLAKITPIYDETWDAEVDGEKVVVNEATVSNENEIVFTFNRTEKEVVDTQA
ncbi:MAG: hypothetical protein IJ391_04640 [Clostridia bacterium]|nr:hypothetical protein [Clostridia bacterium]